MASRRNGTLYTGVTSNLPRHIHEYRTSLQPGSTSRYGCRLLVFYEFYGDMPAAIARESNQSRLAAQEARTDRGLGPEPERSYDSFA